VRKGPRTRRAEKKGYAAKAKAKLRATVWLSGKSEIP
jgi:hypothetical protein